MVKNSSRFNEDCVVSATSFILGAAFQIWIRAASEWGDIMQFSAYGKANQNVYFSDFLFLCIAVLIIITYYCRTDEVDTPTEGSLYGEVHVYQVSPSDAT